MSTALPRTIGPYRLEEKLGSGGMGVVYRAIDTQLDRPVAIKMMHARELLGDDVNIVEVQTRFLREAKAAARIRSRHVAQVLQLGTTDDGEAYIVMELLHGTALSRVMHKSGGPMKPARVVHIARQICRGMQAAHELGVVHRDLKPANVMLVDEEGDPDFVKVLDFGVAKLTDDGQQQGLTQTGALLGTLPFMAPEQIGGGAIDARTDVYALGIILYRMFTGLTVWDADSLGDIVRHQLSSTPPSMFERVTRAQFTPAIDAAVLKCLAKAPADRWSSMRELAVALDAALLQTAPTTPALDATFNDDNDNDSDGANDTLDVRPASSDDRGTAPTGNVRIVGGGASVAPIESGGVDVFRDDTIVSSGTGTAVVGPTGFSSSSSSLPAATSTSAPTAKALSPRGIDPRLLGPDDADRLDSIDPAAQTASRLDDSAGNRRATSTDRLFPSVGAGPVAPTSSSVPSTFGGPGTATGAQTGLSQTAASSLSRAQRRPINKAPIAAVVAVLVLLLGVGLWQATTPSVVVAPLPPVEMATTPSTTTTTAPSTATTATTTATATDPAAAPASPSPPAPLPPSGERGAQDVVPTPTTTTTTAPASTAPSSTAPTSTAPPTTKTPKAKKPAAEDDGFVRVRTKDGR